MFFSNVKVGFSRSHLMYQRNFIRTIIMIPPNTTVGQKTNNIINPPEPSYSRLIAGFSMSQTVIPARTAMKRTHDGPQFPH
jgi:hypothetical protein